MIIDAPWRLESSFRMDYEERNKKKEAKEVAAYEAFQKYKNGQST